MPEDVARRIYRLMVITAWADGKVDAPETEAARELARQEAALAALTDTEGLAREAKQSLDTLGLKGALAAEASGLTERADRELAFYCCARVLEADRKIAFEEFELLGRLRRLFDFSDSDVGKLLARARGTT